MDVDTTEIQVWTRQADGSHQMRWVLLRDLMKLMEQATLSTFVEALLPARELGARPTGEQSSPVPPE